MIESLLLIWLIFIYRIWFELQMPSCWYCSIWSHLLWIISLCTYVPSNYRWWREANSSQPTIIRLARKYQTSSFYYVQEKWLSGLYDLSTLYLSIISPPFTIVRYNSDNNYHLQYLAIIQDRDFDRKVVTTSFVYVSTVAAISVTSAMENNNNASTTATPTASTTPQSNSINSEGSINSSSDSISSNSSGSGSGSERDHPNSNSNSISNHNNLDDILGTDQNVDPFSILWDNS